MQQSKEMTASEKQNVADEAMASIGESPAESVVAEESEQKVDPIQERIGRQEKRHKKELREMQARMEQMQHLLSQTSRQDPNPMNIGNEFGQEDERVQRAVQMALNAQKEQERQAKEQEKMAHVHKQYQALQDHLDNASSQYDDFDDVVRSSNAPYTEAMRDTALLLPNAAEVLYKLGKSRNELERIAALHPLDQAKELVKMSVALMGGNGGKKEAPRPIGQIKSNPVVNARGIDENTSVSELRKRMKATGRL